MCKSKRSRPSCDIGPISRELTDTIANLHKAHIDQHAEHQMSYGVDLRGSAFRHWYSAIQLSNVTPLSQSSGCSAVAGYLFGLAGELAVKHMLRSSGQRPLAPSERRSDPYYAHFPELKTLLRDSVSGRRSGELRAIAEDQSLFSEWDTDMRYAPTLEIPSTRVAQWRAHAQRLISRMDT